MTIASKTELLQMRFVSKGQPFCNIAAKTSIDAAGTMDFYRQGDAFSGVSNEITPPVYSYIANPVRQGNAFKLLNAKSTIDSNYGRVTQGQPFYIQSSTHSYPVYAVNPVRQGNAFKWLTAKSTIDASSDFYQQGAPFYVYYSGAAPPVIFNATRMFMIF